MWIDSWACQKIPVVTKRRSNNYLELPRENVSGNMIRSHWTWLTWKFFMVWFHKIFKSIFHKRPLCPKNIVKIAISEMKSNTEQKIKLEQLHKVGSECKLNSWQDSSVGWHVWTESSGRGFKSDLGQFSIATSKNHSVMNTISISSFRYTHVIIFTRFLLNIRSD